MRRMLKMRQMQTHETKVEKYGMLALPMPVPVHGQVWSNSSITTPQSRS